MTEITRIIKPFTNLLLITAILFLITTSNSKANYFDKREKAAIKANAEYLGNQINKNRPSKADFDNNDFMGCPILFWKGNLREKRVNNWGHRLKWKHNDGWITNNGICLDCKIKSHERIKLIIEGQTKPRYRPIYIGPWEYVEKVGNHIRFFAYQAKGGGHVQFQYETMDEENKKIAQQPLKIVDGAPPVSKVDLCTVKWIAKFGYNTIAQTHYPGFFNNIFKARMEFTGKMVEAGGW